MQYPVPELKIDCKLNPMAVGNDLVYALKPLEPYGTGNQKPVFALMGMKLVNIISIAGGKHLRLIAAKNNTTVAMVLFGMGPDVFPFEVNSVLDFAVTLDIKEYQGEEQLSVMVKDFKCSNFNENYEQIMTLYEAFLNKTLSLDDAKKLFFDRKELAVVYRAIQAGKDTLFKLRCNIPELSFAKILVMTDVMEELGLIKTEGVLDNKKISLMASSKVELENSSKYCYLLNTVGESA